MKCAVLFGDKNRFAHMPTRVMVNQLQFLADNSDSIKARRGPVKGGLSADPAGGLWVVEAFSVGQFH